MTDGGAGTPRGFVRRRALSAHSSATMRTVVDCGDAGRVVLDEPAQHGGTGEGPTTPQAVLGALCGCEAVTFSRLAGSAPATVGRRNVIAQFHLLLFVAG